MWGQWLGKISGDNNGIASLNIDRDLPFAGRITIADNDPDKPSFHASVVLEHKGSNIIGRLSDFTLFSYTSDPDKRDAEESALPKQGTLTGIEDKTKIEGQWETDIGTKGAFFLNNFDDYYLKDADKKMSWDAFNEWALAEKRNNSGLIFRGHSDAAYTLQTSFHRVGRRNLINYSSIDVPELSRNVSATIGRSFSLFNAEEHGELLYLAQHHGYPTPLLDWTESPYVAAYFSFHGLKRENLDGFVRIYQFDKDLWHQKHNVVTNIADPSPSFSALSLHARDNKRALPQQSIVTFSNVFNIELFINYHEEIDGQKYLKIIDINKADRNLAMKDLEIMGITAASLFPGLDGTCNALREKRF